MVPDQAGQEEISGDSESCANAKVRHDIRASLAITRGFSKALESSFGELCQTVEHVLADSDVRTDGETVSKITELEADCSFCLSRIERSLEQLSVRIDASSVAASGVEGSERSPP